jgi:hypothetical protein
MGQGIQDLSLYQDVERGKGFVADDHLGVESKCRGDGHTLAPATGELIGEALHHR